MPDMEEQILKLLGAEDYAPSNVPELLLLLDWPRHRQQELQRVLRGLEQSGRIARTKGNRYILSVEADLVPGRLRMNKAGKGFLQPDDPGLKEIMVPEEATGTALHEDRVLVRRDVRPGMRRDDNEQQTGSVIRILERKRSKIVGTLQQGRQFLYVIPDDPRMPKDIIVPQPRDVGRPANVGDKVVVELQEWESRNINPEGEIIEVLGAPDEEGVDMLSVLRQYNLPLHFPKNVLAEARSFGTAIQPHELAGREDCRAHMVVTIDPDDAKDFDDAICLQRISQDQWKLWVHIADVSHYVKPGTALDTEARERGNSTYLVDRVIPMLPEALSNELCSLKPDVDRLTKCVEFMLSNDGRVMSSVSYAAVIHSQRRFTYKQVLAILQKEPEDAIERMLHDANEMAQKIRKLRFRAGSLDLDFPETKIRLDEKGQISRIEKIENDISHQLIEEYMLLANEAVARQLMRQNIPAIYRVHEEPDERRLNDYRQEVLSHHVQVGNLTKRPEVQKLLQKLGTISIGAALKIGFLRSLMRARYAVEPLGHYGLAKKEYTHFTSPIRRYSDLVVHRALFSAGHGSVHSLKQTSEHISDTERNSADAERDSKDVKLYAFLRGQLKSPNPPRYTGLVTDVRNFGFFVDVSELAMSGLVHCSMLEDDFYVFDAARAELVGRRNRRVIRLGDRVPVQIARVDQFKKQVDFRLAREPRGESKVEPRRDTSSGSRFEPRREARGASRNEPRRDIRSQQRSEPRRDNRGPARPAQGSQPRRDTAGEPRPAQGSQPKREPRRWETQRPAAGKPNILRTSQAFSKFQKPPKRRRR